MKLKPIEKLCKSAGCIYLFDETLPDEREIDEEDAPHLSLIHI